MKRFKLSSFKRVAALTFIMALLASIFFMMPSAEAQSKSRIREDARDTLQNLQEKNRSAYNVVQRAAGVLVFPKVYQAGIFAIGGEYGKGALMIKGKEHGFYRMTSGSVGFQLGGQRKSVILAFLTQQALNEFLNSKGWEIGLDASVAVITVGAEGNIDTKSLENKPVVAFVTDQKGLMYNLSLEGTKITRL